MHMGRVRECLEDFELSVVLLNTSILYTTPTPDTARYALSRAGNETKEKKEKVLMEMNVYVPRDQDMQN